MTQGPMIHGLGTDIIEISRIREAMQEHGDAFIMRILTPSEIAYCKKHHDPSPLIAARFSSKESIAKALGCGFGTHLSWHDIEISHDSSGKPIVTLSPTARQRFNNPTILLSLSHCKEYATSVAIIINSENNFI